MTTLATSNLKLSDIQAILSDTGNASLYDMCNHANVEPLGLDMNYCPGAGVTARHTSLKGPPCNMGYFRGYMAPNYYAFCQDYVQTPIARCVYGEALHPSVYWNGGFQYYTGTVFVEQQYNITALICNTQSVGDIAANLGAVNQNMYIYTPGSPGWMLRFEDETWPLAPSGGPSLAAGSYYWCWRCGVYFYSDDYGDDDYFMPLTIYDYLVSDPDTFNNFSSGGGSSSFEVWTGIYTTSVAVSGGVYLTGGTTGTGNRTQNFTIPNNSTGYPITHHILTTASGVTSSHVYIYQLA